MKATELKSEGLKKEFKIVIPAKDFEQKVDDKLNEVSKNVKLPGFRPGKAPKAMLKQKYKASVMGEVVDEAVRSATEELIKDKKLRPAMMPDVKITAFGEGKDLEFEVSLEELPEIKAGDFSEIELEKLTAEVPAEEVDKALPVSGAVPPRKRSRLKKTEPLRKATPPLSTLSVRLTA